MDPTYRARSGIIDRIRYYMRELSLWNERQIIQELTGKHKYGRHHHAFQTINQE